MIMVMDLAFQTRFRPIFFHALADDFTENQYKLIKYQPCFKENTHLAEARAKMKTEEYKLILILGR